MVGAVVLLAFFIIVANFGFLYIQAMMSGAHVGLWDLVGMRLRKVDPRVIVINRITASKAGLPITTDKLEAHYLAGGHVESVVRALIAANKANIALTWDR
ncbi:MAG: flotillin-like FloA family protein, partial [Planctomycetes bacterium]|nr:flotillin-like FloA family protein [Planctomycetota bacterium]